MNKKTSRNLLCIAIIFFWASEYCHTPYFAPYLQSLGFGANLIGFMTGVYGFTQIFARIPIGMVTDAFSCYKKTILFGCIATTISSFFLMFATSFVTIIICRILAGLAASTWLAFSVLYNAYFKDDESVRAMTNVNAFSNGGKLLAFFLGILTASFFGYKIPLLCSFLTGLVAIVAVILLKPISIQRESFSFSHAAKVIKNPIVIFSSILAIMMQFYMQATVFSFTSSRARECGASSFLIGAISLTFTIIQVLAAPYIGKKFLIKNEKGKSLFIGYSLLGIASLLIALIKEPIFYLISSLLAGFGNLIINGLLMAIVVSCVSEEKRSTAMGTYQAIYGIGMSLGPVVLGKIITNYSYESAYLFTTLLMALTALLSWPLARKLKVK